MDKQREDVLPNNNVMSFRVEDVRRELEKAKVQSKGMEAGRQETERVLGGELMAGVPIDSTIEGSPLERPYLIGFWRGVAETIRKRMNPVHGELGGWDGLIQTIEGRTKDAEIALERGDTAKVDMGDVQDKINQLMDETQEANTMRLAA